MLVAGKLSKQQLHDFEEMEEEGFEGYFEAGEDRPLIPEGIYKARCIKIEKGIYHGTVKIYLRFQITEPYEHEGAELFMAMNVFKIVPPGAKYYKQWVIANENINPARKDRMSPSIFKNGIFKAIVRTVKPKDENDSKYSIIDTLKDRVN